MRTPKINWRPHWFVDYTGLRREGSRQQGRKLTYRALEVGGNDFLVTLVAGVGFFTDSYVLFASNAILPMLGFIYWHNSIKPTHETAFNIATLAGCILGMLLFGILGDKYGRRKMYGLELIVLIVGTVGVLMSSTGYVPLDELAGADVASLDYGSFGSMDIQSWLLFWRFVSGVGIGGDYPLSSVIVSEFAPTRKRPRMLATIFSMQAFGYAAATIVSLIVVSIVRRHHPYDTSHPQASARAVDQVWRWVTGLGLVPALLAVVMRLTIPESSRYTLDVLDNPVKAFEETDRFNHSELESEFIHQSNLEIVEEYGKSANAEGGSQSSETIDAEVSHDTTPNASIRQYFWIEGNWRYLMATALSWFLLDFALYGLGMSSPQTISKLWYDSQPNILKPEIWNTDYEHPNASIFTILIEDSVHSLLISSIAAIVGSVLLILVISHVNRKLLLWVMFLVCAALFIIIGATFQRTVETQFTGVTITLYALCQFCLYFGPNPLTFILPAELFPTKYRASCHGISGAAGKFGSVIVQLFLGYGNFGGTGRHEENSSNPHSKWLGWVLLIFALPMLIGAFISWFYLPDLQCKDRKNKTLEELALGRAGSRVGHVEEQLHEVMPTV